MASKRLALLIVAFVGATSLQAIAQGAGGGSAGAGSAAGSAATGGAPGSGSAATGGTSDVGTTGMSQTNTQATTAAPAGSPTAAQANRNAGVGTAPNGLPIGAPGSGVGSPEQPVGPTR
jgi:hypothetical protein